MRFFVSSALVTSDKLIFFLGTTALTVLSAGVGLGWGTWKPGGRTTGIYIFIKYKKEMEPETITLIIVSIIGAIGSLLSILHFKKCHAACIESECFKGNNTPISSPITLTTV